MAAHRYLPILAAGFVLNSLATSCAAQPAGAASAAITQKQAQASAGQPRFGLPIDCRLGENCFIMHYVDIDPSPAERDFACGRQTYDGHDGTDFAIANEKIMAAGVAVVSIAAGQVLRTRDGVPDVRIASDADRQTVAGEECGNGLVIDHGLGFEAQYCHLRRGSVQVKPGAAVVKGAVLGLVGESGLAGFPHVHLTLRYRGKPIDPFVGLNAPPGCGGSRLAVWDQPLAYVPTGLVQAGFSTQAPSLGEVLAGRYQETTFPASSPALIFWVHAFGVLPGDIESFTMTPPGGQPAIQKNQALTAAMRSWVSFIGKKNSLDKPLATGAWQAHYSLTRGQQVIIDIQREARLQ